MLLFPLILSLTGFVAAWPSILSPRETKPKYETFDNVTVYKAPANWTNRGVSYGRVLLLNQNCEIDNVILSTWSLSAPNKTYLPVYKSTDFGKTWTSLSKVYFKKEGYTAIAQPFLYETSQRFGAYPAGTVLIAGNAWNGNGTDLELHASLDKGKTWKYVSTVTKGGRPNTNDGGTSIWEPFIMAHKNKLGYFYSDSRDPLHSQKLAHQTTTDLKHWDLLVNDARDRNYTIRPGMTSIAELGNGKFIFAYEVDKVQGFPKYANQPVHYKIADSPFEFDKATQFPLVASTPDNTTASSAPQVIWSPAGGKNGTIILSGSHEEAFFINTANGDPKEWKTVVSGHGVGYSRALQIIPGTDGKVILVFNGGAWGNTIEKQVTAGNWIVPGPGSKKDGPGFSNCVKDGPGHPSHPPPPHPHYPPHHDNDDKDEDEDDEDDD
ncbi:hypothetical protein VTL71DRAFT_8880 [Oculimacula yallundae]|uniref:BNR/Asp-box repeat domain protein n=1 Tax=Oculimacula yallundae TaxID=86028 RepID=A0ABR4BT94_9HELO